RPAIVPQLTPVDNLSFPSGHAQISTITFLTLGTILARLVGPKRLKVYILATALLLTFLIGVSRVYLGVHYPSDVLAGWTAGIVWALGCWAIARFLQRRKMVENLGSSERDKEEEVECG
ncbi:MAG: phosphatase PAP2 family protein, partial [Planctomycetaceae bacterium]